MQGLAEEASDAVAVAIDADDNVGVGADMIIFVAGATFAEFGSIGAFVAVIHEVLVDDWLSVGIFFAFFWFGSFLAVGDDFFCGVLGYIYIVADRAVVVVGVSKMIIANFAAHRAEIDSDAIGGDSVFSGFDLRFDVGIKRGVNAAESSFGLMDIKVNRVGVFAEIVSGLDEVIIFEAEGVAGRKGYIIAFNFEFAVTGAWLDFAEVDARIFVIAVSEVGVAIKSDTLLVRDIGDKNAANKGFGELLVMCVTIFWQLDVGD